MVRASELALNIGHIAINQRGVLKRKIRRRGCVELWARGLIPLPTRERHANEERDEMLLRRHLSRMESIARRKAFLDGRRVA